MANNNTNTMKIIFEGDSKQLEAAVKKAEKALKGFDQKTKKTGGGKGGGALGGMLATAKKLAPALSAAFAVREIAAFGKEAVNLAAQLEGVERNFKMISAQGKTSMMELKAATMGTVSEIDLMQKAVMAKNFKIPLENLAQFFEFATVRAQQTGESVDYLVNSIVLGIGRKSPLILDNLGITLVRLKEAMGKVGRESATVAEISEGVSRIAKEEVEVMKILGKTAITSAQQIATLSAQWKDFKTSFGEGVLDGGGGVLDSITESLSLRDLEFELYAISRAVGLTNKAFHELVTTTTGLDGHMMGATREDLLKIASALQELHKGQIDFYKENGKNMLAEILAENPNASLAEIKELGATMAAEYGAAFDTKTQDYIWGGFLNAYEEREQELNEIEKKEKARADKIKSIQDTLVSALTKNAEKFRQDGDVMAKLASDTQAYGAATQSLTEIGEIGSVSFKRYSEQIVKLKDIISDKELLASYEEMIKQIKASSDEHLIASQRAFEYRTELEKLFEAKRKNASEVEDGELFPDGEWEGYEEEDAPSPNLDDLNGKANEHLQKLQKMATMWGIISQAIGGIADNINGESGFAKGVKVLAKLAQTAAATAAAVAAVKSAFDPSAGAKMVATAVGVATALGGILGAVGGISTGGGGAGFASSYNGGETKTYTELRGRDIRIAETRDRLFSDRRG